MHRFRSSEGWARPRESACRGAAQPQRVTCLPRDFRRFLSIHSQWYGESMSDASASGVLDGLLESLSRCLDAESARRVAHFRVAAHVQERVDMLAERANEGLLTGEERDEYEAFINASDLIAILKLKALRALDSNQHS